MTTVVLKLAFAFVFAGGCAIVYRLLAKKRPDVRKEAVWVFLTLLLLGVIRALSDLL